MIVCMNYNTDGSRYIAKILYQPQLQLKPLMNVASEYTDSYDEVYILDVKLTDKELIDTIVIEGCRV